MQTIFTLQFPQELTFYMLGNFSKSMSSADFCFQNYHFQKKKNSGILSVSNSLDPDQTSCFVGPDLVPKCEQRLQADDLIGRINHGIS